MGDYWYSTGGLLPVDQALIRRVLRRFQRPIEAAIAGGGMSAEQSSLMAEEVLRVAICRGLTGRVEFR